MCQVLNKSKRKIFTGYKMVVKKNKKYYSPMTGIEYTPGKEVTIVDDVETWRKYSKNRDDSYIFKQFHVLLSGGHPAYSRQMRGKTAVFMTKRDAIVWADDSVIIVKMTLSKELHYGNYDCKKVILGEFIESIEEIK